MLHSRSTLFFKLLFPLLPILYLLSLPPHHRPLLLAVLLRCLPPLLPCLPKDSSMECWRFLSQKHWTATFFRPIPLTSSASRIPILNQLPLSGFSALRSDRTHSRSSILSRDVMHASGGIIIFVRQGLSFSEFSTSFLSLLDPYSNYVDFNISLNNFPSLSFLNVHAAPIRSSPTDGKTDSFLPSILPSSTNLFILGDFNCHHPLWGSRGTFDPRGRKYLTGSSPLTSPSQWP